MLNITFNQLFGANATQDINTLVISKKDLAGLVATDSNKAEQLLVALLVQALSHFEGYLTDRNGTVVTSFQGIPVTYQNHIYKLVDINTWEIQKIDRNNTNYLQNTLVINFFTLDEVQDIPE